MRVSHRGLQASFGHIAADCYVPVVFAAVKWHQTEGALGNGLLPACALDAVHVDGAGTYRGGRGATDHGFTCLINQRPHSKRNRHTRGVHKSLLNLMALLATDVHGEGLKAQTRSGPLMWL